MHESQVEYLRFGHKVWSFSLACCLSGRCMKKWTFTTESRIAKKLIVHCDLIPLM